MASKDRLIAIVGETGTGKSDLAIKLAEKFGGEIICADSRTIYKGMDILTAKPSKDDQARIPHHLLDLIEPDQKFSAAEFKDLANQLITDINSRGKVPILVGGTGLYINSVIFDYSFDPKVQRDPKNQRHAIKRPNDDKLRPNTLLIGLRISRERLEKRLAQRIKKMTANGLVDEVRQLMSKYPPDCEAFKAPGFRAFAMYCKGEISLSEAQNIFLQHDLQLAKKQRTWFRHPRYGNLSSQEPFFSAKTASGSVDVRTGTSRSPEAVLARKSTPLSKTNYRSVGTERNKSIHWFSVPANLEKIVDLATTFLNT